MSRRANGEGTLVKRADGRWQASGYVLTSEGGRKRVHYYGKTRAEASGKLIAGLENSRRFIPVARKAWTVDGYLTYWLRTIVPVKTRPRTAELYESTVRLHIVPYIGRKPLAKLSVQDVQDTIGRLQSDGHSHRTLHRVRTVLSSALSRAQKEELVYRNVARLVDLPQYERKTITPWPLDQARQFLDAAAGHRWGVGYQMLVTYGMRRGEVLGLQWQDIDFTTNVIHVTRQLQRIDGALATGPVKTSSGRRDLPLLPHIREALLTMRESRTPTETAHVLISKTGTPVDPKNFVRTFHEIRDRAQLPRITVHHTRHTAATLLKNLGVPVRDIQLILGHANISTTQEIYQHGDVTRQREALTQIAEALTTKPASQCATEDNEQDEFTDCCQQSLSNGSDEMISSQLQVSEGKKNRRSTDVDTADFLGGSNGARTHDTLLKSLTEDTFAQLPTSIITALRIDAHRRKWGAVVVKNGCQTVPPIFTIKHLGITSAGYHHAIVLACDQALTAKLRRASFPLSLLPTSPRTIDDKEGRHDTSR